MKTDITVDDAGNVTERQRKDRSKGKSGKIFYSPDGFYMEMPGGRFQQMDVSSIKRQLAYDGVDVEFSDGNLKNWERVITLAQRENEVDYAGPLAGYKVGLIALPSGEKLLVTKGFNLALAKAGDCAWLEKFCNQLLGPEQLRYFMLWLKFARQSLREASFRPGQYLVLCGPGQCGKSLLQAIITHSLTGRVADPWRYLQDKTPFNLDLCQAEHLASEDKAGSFDIRKRIAFGSAIKDMSAVTLTSVHGKGKTAITLRVFKRGSYSLNNEPEHVMVLPPMDSSLRDKMFLFKCDPATVEEDKVKVWKRIVHELPGFLDVVDNFPAVRSLSDSRYGVKAFLHPEIVAMLEGLSPESRLNDLVLDIIFDTSNRKEWEGTSEALENALRDSPMQYAVQSLATFPTWCGVYLSRLRTQFPDRFTSRKVEGRTVWTISKHPNKGLF